MIVRPGFVTYGMDGDHKIHNSQTFTDPVSTPSTDDYFGPNRHWRLVAKESWGVKQASPKYDTM